MESMFTAIIESGNVTMFIPSLIVYLIIHLQRKSTRQSRDDETALLKYKVEQLENNQSQFTTKLDKLSESVNELKVGVNVLLERTSEK